ncbi:unnamed protein product, partial [Didymodactylos carnosus]
QIEVTQSNVKNFRSSTALASSLPYPNDRKFQIQETHSSIDVVLDDLSQVSSLATLVHFCLDTAQERNIKSIVFPCIGIDAMIWDSSLVPKAMIDAASERLHKYKMNVIYAICKKPQDKYPETDPCY